MKLVEDVCDVRLYCRLADEELFADRLVGQPLGHQAKNLNLPFGEGGEVAAQFAATRCIALDQPTGDRWGEQRVAGRHQSDGRDQLLGRDVLEEEAAGTDAQGGVNILVEIEGRQHDDSTA